MQSGIRVVGAMRALVFLSVVAIACSVGLPLSPAHGMSIAGGADTLSRSAPLASDQASLPASATFEFTFEGVPEEARAALRYAADIWGRQITSPVPIKIRVRWTDEYSYDNNKGRPHSYIANFPNAPQRDTLYPIALANKLAGYDLRTVGADDFDIDMLFRNSSGWYFGTDANDGHEDDFVTVVLRAIGHGLGFTSSFSKADDEYLGRWGAENRFPYIFDRFMVDTEGRSLLDTAVYPNPSVELANALGRTMFWNGEHGRAAAGNENPALYRWDYYESINGRVFLDEETYSQGDENALMTVYIGYDGAIHDPGPIVRGMLKDIGWDTQAASFPGQPMGSIEIVPTGALDDGRSFTGVNDVRVDVRNWGGSASRLRLEVDGTAIYDGEFRGGTGRWMVLHLDLPTFSGCAPKTIVGTLEGNGERTAPFEASILVDGGVDATVAVGGYPGGLTWSPQTPRYEIPLDPAYTTANRVGLRVTPADDECNKVEVSFKFVKTPSSKSGITTRITADQFDNSWMCLVCGQLDAPDGEYQFYVEATDDARNTRRFPSDAGVYRFIHDSVAPTITIGESMTDPSDGVDPGFALVDLHSFQARDNLYPDQGNGQEYYGYWVMYYPWTDLPPHEIDPPGAEVWFTHGHFVRGTVPSTLLLRIPGEPGVPSDAPLRPYRVWVSVLDGAGNMSEPVSPQAFNTDVSTVHLPLVRR